MHPGMDTFLVAIPKVKVSDDSSLNSVLSTAAIAAAVRRVVSTLPHLGIEFSVESETWLADNGGRMTWARSTPERGSSLVHHVRTGRGGALVFGEVLGSAPDATTVWETFLRGGVYAVHDLDGCFSALIWNATTGAVDVIADSIGQRTLRMAETDSCYWFSPHDTCLVACGAARVEFDPVSAFSCLIVENSLRAKPLLLDVQGLEANDRVHVALDTGAVRYRLPKIDFSNRIDVRDKKAQQQCREEVADSIVQASSPWARSGREIRCELTAGLDSRASLACIIAARAQSRTVAITSGAPDSVDVRTAARLARLAGARHLLLPAPSDDTTHFQANLELRAFAMNGETDAKRAAKPVPIWDPDGPIRVEGTSGEVYRGFLYQYFGPTGIAPDAPSAIVDVMLRRRCRRFTRTPVSDSIIRSGLRERMLDCFGEYQTLTTCGNDMLDLFWLFERCSRWAAHVRRSSWSMSRNVFLVPSAIRKAYTMPAPIGFWTNVHAHLIKEHFPAAQWILLNGIRPLQLEGPGRLRNAARLGLTGARMGFDRMKGSINPSRSTPTKGPLSGALFTVVRDLVSASDSISTLTMGSQGVEKVLDEQEVRGNHQALLGYAVTQEVYRNLLLRVRPSVSE